MKLNIQPTQKRKRQGFTLVELLVVIAIIASLAGLSYGPIMKHLESSARTEAISNGKMIHSALLGFMGQNDSTFPNEDTGTAADTAEDCLQQLIDGDFVGEEQYFWNKANERADLCAITKPDNNGTLDKDENVWGYTRNLSPGSDTGAPILFDSCVGVDSFDTAPWKGKAIVVKVDGSCVAMNITYTGKPVSDDGTSQQGAVEQNGGSSGGKVSIFESVDQDEVLLTTQ